MALFKSKAQTEVERLTAENDELRNDLHEVLAKHKDNTKLEAKIIEARKELTTVNKQNDSIRAEIAKLLIDKSNYEAELKKFGTHLQSLKSSEKETLKSIQQAKEDLRALDTKKESGKLLGHELSEEVEKKRKEIKELNTIIGSIENIREEEEGLLDKIKLLKLEEETRLRNLSNIISQTEVNENIKKELDAAIGKLIIRIDENHDALNESVAKKTKTINELQERNVELLRLKSDIDVLKQTISQFEVEKNKLIEEKEKLSDDIKRFETIKSELNDEILKKRETDESLSSHITELKEQVNNMDKLKFEIEETNISIEKALSATVQKFNDEISLSHDRLANTRKEILDKEKILKDKEKILSEKSAQIAEVGALSKVLEKEKQHMESQLNDLNSEKKDLLENINHLKESQIQQKKYTSELKIETEQLEKRRAELENSIKDLLAQGSNNYSRSESSKQKVTEELSEKHKELRDVDAKLEEAKEELRRMKNEARQIESQKDDYTSKVSELISLEKRLKQKIAGYQANISDSEARPYKKEDDKTITTASEQKRASN